MDILVDIGGAMAALGLVGLLYCIWLAFSAKRAKLPEAEMKERMQKIVAMNMGALFTSALGLMFVVVGVLL